MSYTPERTGYSGMQDNPESPIVNWDRIIHKNVRTSDGVAHGKVIAIPDNKETVIITSQGSRGEYEVPRSSISGFNGAEVMINLTSKELKSYKVQETAAFEAEHKVIEDIEIPKPTQDTIPVVEERLKVSKKQVKDEASIIKEPIIETRTVEVPVTHEEIRIERRPASDTLVKEKPVQSRTEIKVPVSREVVEVKKEPFVKEEVVVKKEPVTETKIVSETVTKEEVKVNRDS